jgi:hypothetical protein
VTWLLTLYPPRWRRRYGAEFLALIAPQPFSVGTAFDIIGGAIDAWTQPQSYSSPRAATHEEGETIMLAKALRLRCAGYGEKVTIADGLKGAAVILGGAVVTVIVVSWLPREPGGNPYRMAILANGWLVPFVISMRYTVLKGWPARTQAVFMGGLISVLVVLTLATGWLAGR